MSRNKQGPQASPMKASKWARDRWKDLLQLFQSDKEWDKLGELICKCRNKPMWWQDGCSADTFLKELEVLIISGQSSSKEQFCRPLEEFSLSSLEQLTAELQAQSLAQDRSDTQGWKLWAEQSTSGGAGRGHWFTKPPQA